MGGIEGEVNACRHQVREVLPADMRCVFRAQFRRYSNQQLSGTETQVSPRYGV